MAGSEHSMAAVERPESSVVRTGTKSGMLGSGGGGRGGVRVTGEGTGTGAVASNADQSYGGEGGTVGAGDVSSDDHSAESSVSEDATWISWFCSLKGNEFFCEVDEDFINDDFNLTGLSSQVAYYNYALDTILDVDIPESELDDKQQELVEVTAETLYGLIHARYILTVRGMHAMLKKYKEGAFGRCPRVHCSGQAVLPVGQSDMPRNSTVKIFCPMCWDIYFPRSRHHSTLDGAYWGTTFPHLFLHTYNNLVPQRNPEKYTPRIYGFKIHKSAVQVQRNRASLPHDEKS